MSKIRLRREAIKTLISTGSYKVKELALTLNVHRDTISGDIRAIGNYTNNLDGYLILVGDENKRTEHA